MISTKSAFFFTVTTVATAGTGSGEFLHFKLALPSGYSLVQLDRPMMDFSLYEFRAPQGKVVARLYVGNHPDFAFDPSLHIRRKIDADTSLVQARSGVEKAGLLLEFENLQYKTQPGSPWSRIHVFNITQDPVQRKMVVLALEQIQIIKRHID